MNIYVGNISFQADEHQLEGIFADYGEVVSVKIVLDRDTGRSRGFGFVEMANNDEGQAAIDALNGFEVEGRELKVNEARPREPRRNNFGGGGGRGGYGGGDRGGYGGGRGDRY